MTTNPIYIIEITLLFGGSWKRVFELDSDMSLYDLHDLIQHVIGFDDDHLWQFHVGSNYRKRDRVFVFSGESMHEHNESLDTRLSEIFPLDRKKLFYLFDYGDSWTFEIRKIGRTKKPESGVAYPQLIESIGPNPQQYGSDDDEGDDEHWPAPSNLPDL